MASDEGGGAALQGDSDLPLTEPPPSISREGRFLHAAVSVDSLPCARVGRDILAREGTAVDAAIAVLLCNGVVTPQSMGLGGGFLMTVYLANGTALSLTARETAPAASSRDMYSGGRSSTLGPAAAGVPGELLGYWQAKQRLGNPAVAWQELVEPSIQLCEQGITVSGHAARSIQSSAAAIRADPGLRELLVRNSTGELLVEGDVYRNPALAATLRAIAARGAAELYTGATGRALVRDMAAGGGLLTEADLAEYRVRWEVPVKAALPGDGLTLYSAPPPGSGAILASILGTVAGYCPSPRSRREPLAWHRFIESCKFAYAQRTLLGDWAHGDSPELGRQVAQLVSNLTSPDWWKETRDKISDEKTEEGADYYGAQFYNVEDAGTTHISVLSPAGQSAAGGRLPPSSR
jgi:gamma-glutamyltranspeptidase/glutathione hydrolase/leukotriene-C4 hydrolase